MIKHVKFSSFSKGFHITAKTWSRKIFNSSLHKSQGLCNTLFVNLICFIWQNYLKMKKLAAFLVKTKWQYYYINLTYVQCRKSSSVTSLALKCQVYFYISHTPLCSKVLVDKGSTTDVGVYLWNILHSKKKSTDPCKAPYFCLFQN